MKPKSDGAPDSRNLEGLRLRTEMLLREFWGVPRGVVPQAPAKLAVAKLFPLLVDLGEQALRAIVKRHAEFSKEGLAACAPFWGEFLQVHAWANAWVIAHPAAAARVPPPIARRAARFLAGLAAYSTVSGSELLHLHRQALGSALVAFDDDKCRKAVRDAAAKAPAAARAFLEEALNSAQQTLSYDRKGSLPELVEPIEDVLDGTPLEDGGCGLVRGDEGREAFFASLGLSAMHVPKAFAATLRKVENDCFATREFRTGPEFLDNWLREAHAGVVADYMLVCRETANIFEEEKPCLHLFLVLGPLKLFAVVPLASGDADAAERARLLAGLSVLVREAERTVERGALRAPDDDFFVIAIGQQIAWCQGGVPAPETFDGIAGHFDDKFPLILEWLKSPRGCGVEPLQIDAARPDGSRTDRELAPFEPRGRLSTPPRIAWVEVADWREAPFAAGVNVHRRAADHDLGELVARVEGFAWREKPGAKTKVYVLPASTGKGAAASRIYPTLSEAGIIRGVIEGWFKDGARVADFEAFVFDERG